MPKRSSKNPRDVIQLAKPIMEQATAEPAPETIKPMEEALPDGKNPAAVALGRLGALKGGKARAAKFSRKRRGEIAHKAAEASWNKKRT